jgi:hypothetical protein
MKIFVTFLRRPWYRKKRYAIPTCLLIILAFVGAIVGIIVGLKAAKSGNIGKIFDVFFNSEANDSSFWKKQVVSFHMSSKIIKPDHKEHVMSVPSFFFL